MNTGPRFRSQLARLNRVWKQGQHVLTSGPTGSGKTTLDHEIVELRAKRKGHVLVFVLKPKEDPTIVKEYKGYVRWKQWRNHPRSWENRILLWPDVSKARGDRAGILEIQKEVFAEAFAGINHKGNYTVLITEGLYVCDPQFLGMSADLAMSHAIGRSDRLTIVTETQRPSHIPLLVYGSASHAYLGRTREAIDQKRLAELGSREGSKELGARISNQGLHDFTWVPVAPDWPAESLNISK